MIETTTEQINKIVAAIKSKKIYGNEAVWNFLITSILSNSSLQKDYFQLFCDVSIPMTSNYDIWFESEPLSPRTKKRGYSEGNTKLDIAFGSIQKRPKTACGIKYNQHNKDSWVCFIEGKFFSDSSGEITHDSSKNQITRVIENLLCFQGEDMLPKKIYFALLTPKKYLNNLDRDYCRKFEEYKNHENILRDIESSRIPKRMNKDWKYPDNLEERVKLLTINWLTYEMIIEKEFNIPELNVINLKNDHQNDLKLNKILSDLANEL
jgi:hypothetical protein